MTILAALITADGSLAPRNLTLSIGYFDAGVEYEQAVAARWSAYAGGDVSLTGGAGLQVGARFFLLGEAPQGLFIDSHLKVMDSWNRKAWTGGATGLMLGATWVPGPLVFSVGAGVDLAAIETEGFGLMPTGLDPQRYSPRIGFVPAARLSAGWNF